MTNFTVGTLIGWVLGTVASLLAAPGERIDKARQALDEALDTFAKETIRNRRQDLVRALRSSMTIAILLLNGLILLVIAAAAWRGPAWVLARVFPEASSWQIGAMDRTILAVIGVIHLLLMLQKFLIPLGKGIQAVRAKDPI
jgi:hypothetical protein